jgi:O-antigen/teichoic acid export membrane protein
MALAAFSSFGVGYAATRYAAELHRRDPVRLGQTLALSESAILGVGSTATFVLYLWFRLAFDSRSQRTGSWSSTGFGCAGDNLFLTGWLSEDVLIGMEAKRAFAVGSIIGMLASFPIILVLSHLYGLNGAAGAMVLNAVVNATIGRFQKVPGTQEIRCSHVARR